jgi:hypothetical protein
VGVKVTNTFLLMVFSAGYSRPQITNRVPCLENRRNENDMRIPAGAPFILNRAVVSRIRIPLGTKMQSILPKFVINWQR